MTRGYTPPSSPETLQGEFELFCRAHGIVGIAIMSGADSRNAPLTECVYTGRQASMTRDRPFFSAMLWAARRAAGVMAKMGAQAE